MVRSRAMLHRAVMLFAVLIFAVSALWSCGPKHSFVDGVCTDCGEVCTHERTRTSSGREATCDSDGMTKEVECAVCRMTLTKGVVIKGGHTYKDNACTRCGAALRVSLGLSFVSSGDGTCYVNGIGSCTDTELVIPSHSPDGDAVVAIDNSAFRSNPDITSITVLEGVGSILGEAFAWCDSLNKVVLPDSLTDIGESAFYMCPALMTLEIPDGVKTIGESAFFGCENLSSVTLGKGITEIGDYAFSSCPSLEEIAVPEGNEAYLAKDGNLYTSDMAILVQYAVGRGDESFTVPDGVLAIGAGAFRGCESLSSISMYGSVISINPYAFDGCTSLSRVYYAATAPEWQRVEIGEGNEPLYEARMLYNFIN